MKRRILVNDKKENIIISTIIKIDKSAETCDLCEACIKNAIKK